MADVSRETSRSRATITRSRIGPTLGGSLPAISRGAFAEAVAALAPVTLHEAAPDLLFAHYETLRRWNPRLALIGPGTTEEVLSRHVGESLAALPWIDQREIVVDVGSGAGFPGLVLALAMPGLRVILVESRSRKWAFLKASLRAAKAVAARFGGRALSLSCTPLNARIGRPLPDGLPSRIDVLTSRGVRLTPEILEPLVDRCRAGRFLLWRGEEAAVPASLRVTRRLQLAASDRRQLIEAVIVD